MIDWKREGLTLPFFAVGAVAGYVLTALLSSLA
jgi:presenilin-like A22 family membrane protease